jgi:hypothetical protein
MNETPLPADALKMVIVLTSIFLNIPANTSRFGFVLGRTVWMHPVCLLYNLVSKLLVAWGEIPWAGCINASISLDDWQQGVYIHKNETVYSCV